MANDTIGYFENSYIGRKYELAKARGEATDPQQDYLYLELKKRGVLIRHFTKERICRYNRITIGTKEQMEVLINTLKEVLL